MKFISCMILAIAVANGESRKVGHVNNMVKKIMAKNGIFSWVSKDDNLESESVINDIFDFGKENHESSDINQLSFKISQKGTMVQIPKEDQVSKWFELPSSSPMYDQGYSHWAPGQNGIIFKPKEQLMSSKPLFQCEANMGMTTHDEKPGHLLQFDCSKFDQTFFTEVSSKLITPRLHENLSIDENSNNTNTSLDLSTRNITNTFLDLSTRNDADALLDLSTRKDTDAFLDVSTPHETDADDDIDTTSFVELSSTETSKLMKAITPQLRAFAGGNLPTFWMATPDGHVPYGWKGDWGDFDYPYYAITDKGCLGCQISEYVQPEYVDAVQNPLTGKTGYCRNAAYFPYTAFSKNDILPYSVYYTSGCGTNWAGTVIPGSTLSMQPNPFGTADSSNGINSNGISVSAQPGR